MKNKYYYIGIEDVECLCDDPQELIEALWFSVNIDEGIEEYKKGLKNFTEPQKYVFAVMWYFGEVNNGGHDQFFFNSTGIVWKDALYGLKAINCLEAENILTEALDRVGGNPPFDREERIKKMEKYNAVFDDLDNAFYRINIIQYISKYIMNNKKEFCMNRNIEMLYD